MHLGHLGLFGRYSRGWVEAIRAEREVIIEKLFKQFAVLNHPATGDHLYPKERCRLALNEALGRLLPAVVHQEAVVALFYFVIVDGLELPHKGYESAFGHQHCLGIKER